jgi:hypothetical protein
LRFKQRFHGGECHVSLEFGVVSPNPGSFNNAFDISAPRVGQVLYVDEALNDATPFGTVRHQAFAIIPKETLLTVGRRMCDKPVSQIDLRWQAVDKLAARFKKHLRPLVTESRTLQSLYSQPMACRLRWMKK